MVRYQHATLKLALLCAAAAAALSAQTDPGVRQGRPGAGRPLPNLNANELAYFNGGLDRFREVDSVTGTEPGAKGSGLGPRFNLNSCAGCHAQPMIGGSSPRVNPQIAMATQYGAQNAIPQFIQQNGPVRVVRFAHAADGSPDGGVHNLFVITGRSDAGACRIAQPDFATAAARNNVFFRIPTPIYGAGLIEAISDSAILANMAANAQMKNQLGIHGHENRNGNDGTVTRFGWKAQNKSLLLFAGEAYNVEQGVTNEIFPNERDETPGCGNNATPEDRMNLSLPAGADSMSDMITFTQFMRLLAPPDPAPQGNPSMQHGSQVFAQIGCALCHTPMLNSGNSPVAALSQKPVPLFSDLLVHNMGDNLADGINQGTARGNDWRTAPLWGLGQRIFLLHDGRTSDLVEAIRQHSGRGSEANQVVGNYDALPASAKQDLLNFLRSL